MSYDDDARVFADALARAMHKNGADAERARLAYGALKARGMLKNYRLIEYRCAARRCLLLDVVNLPSPVGLVMHQPRYKRSPELNLASSNESGRRANTEDGDHRWHAQTYPRHQAGADGSAVLNCDHVDRISLRHHAIEADLAAGRRSVLVG